MVSNVYKILMGKLTDILALAWDMDVHSPKTYDSCECYIKLWEELTVYL